MKEMASHATRKRDRSKEPDALDYLHNCLCMLAGPESRRGRAGRCLACSAYAHRCEHLRCRLFNKGERILPFFVFRNSTMPFLRSISCKRTANSSPRRVPSATHPIAERPRRLPPRHTGSDTESPVYSSFRSPFRRQCVIHPSVKLESLYSESRREQARA